MIECKFCGLPHGIIGGKCEAEKKAIEIQKKISMALMAHWISQNSRQSAIMFGTEI